MSPYPAQITRDVLIEKAWELVEAKGIDQLSLAKLAEALGIKAPSLYHHMRNKAELLKAVNELTSRRLFTALNVALNGRASDSPQAKLLAIAAAYRAFAHAHPIAYGLAFTTIEADSRPDPAEQEQAALPLQAIMAEISGEVDSLAALRGTLALMHGFVMLELNEQFRRGGDLDAAYQRVMEAYLRGWEKD